MLNISFPDGVKRYSIPTISGGKATAESPEREKARSEETDRALKLQSCLARQGLSFTSKTI